MTIGTAAEIAANYTQQLMFIAFLYLFFDKPKERLKRLLPLCAAGLVTLLLSAYFTLNDLTFHYSYYLTTVAVLIIYTAVFLRGRLFLRILIPTAVSNILIAYLTVSVMSAFGKLPFGEAVGSSEAFRYLVLFTANAIYAAFLFIIYRFGKGKINMKSHLDILAFIVMPLITCVIGWSSLLVLEAVNFDGEIQFYITLIALSTAAVVIVFWYLLIKSGREYRVKTDLMLSKQREEMYKSSVLGTNEQIEKVSAVRHDMKNNLMSVSKLLSQGEYDRARDLCDSLGEQLEATYTPAHTENPALNAIINVELEKAQSREIDFSYELSSPLFFMKDEDLISAVANLCDNAIEYLGGLETKRRRMSLSISSYKSYCKIVCKNAIASSVLADNPNLNTTKNDKTLHGRGMEILRKIAQKYNGELLLSEKDNQFTATVIIAER